MSDYPSFRKIPRLHKDVVITEKLDGTNGLVFVRDMQGQAIEDGETLVHVGDDMNALPIVYGVRAGSRNRWLTTKEDNAGFAKWVESNAEELVKLGPGHHYGEWFGQGVQRGYGLTEKRFALFNCARWYDRHDGDAEAYWLDFPGAAECPEVCTVVPVLAVVNAGRLNSAVETTCDQLRTYGSVMCPGFKNPEGLIIYHPAAGQLFKVLLEGDDIPKTLQEMATA